MAIALGLFSMTTGPCSYPEGAARVARAAEVAGFDSLWGGEHVVLPDPQAPPAPLGPTDRIADPVVTLAFVAGHTTRIRLGTGIIILPQRNPLVLAKELATLDVLSGGRLIVGIGVGYLEAEFRALGAQFKERGRATDEHLAAMRAIWGDGKPAYRGRFVSFEGVDAHPKPVQRPHPPLVIGGHTPAAFRRAVEQGNGWYGFALDADAAKRCVEGLRAAAQQRARPAALGPLHISVTPRGRVDRDLARRFEELGVHRLIVTPPRAADAAGIVSFVEALAGEILVRA